MDAWNLILLVAVSAIWLAMISAVAWLTAAARARA
jgi:hypothetical protein